MSSGTQISDMTLSVTLPSGSYAPFIVTDPLTGLSPLSNYRYDLGADLLTRASYTVLAQATGAALIGSTGPSTVQADLDARPTSAELAAPTGAAGIGYLSPGTGTFARTVEDKLFESVSILDYIPEAEHAAIEAGTSTYDCAPHLVAAWGDAYTVLFPGPGIYPFNTAIVDIRDNRGIVLKNRVILIRQTASASTAPILHLKGANCSIFGSGRSSGFETEKDAPDGLILLGAPDMQTGIGKDNIYCTLSDFSVQGQQPYGKTAGDPDAGIKVINPQIDGFVSYLHTIKNISFEDLNYGLWLQGWANEIEGGIFRGYHLGDNAAHGMSALVFCQGALECDLTKGFLHYSPGGVVLKIEDYDNTGTPGGVLHVAAYNNWRLGGEQDPTPGTGLCLVANANCTAFKNTFHGMDNVVLGYDISALFRNNNTLYFSSSGYSIEQLDVRDTATFRNDVQISGFITGAKEIIISGAGFGYALKGGTNCKIDSVTLVAGVAVVANTRVEATSRIFIQRQTDGGTVGASYSISARSAGVGFTITAKDGAGATQTLDTSTVSYLMMDAI